MWVYGGFLFAFWPFLRELLFQEQDISFMVFFTFPIGLTVAAVAAISFLFSKKEGTDTDTVYDPKQAKRIIWPSVALIFVPDLLMTILSLLSAPPTYSVEPTSLVNSLFEFIGTIIFFVSFISIPLGIVLLIKGAIEYFAAKRQSKL